jgi:exonuclease VII large subunit
MESKVFSVSELVEYVNGQLSEEIVVEGEISRIDVRQGNLVFITLVDAYSALDVFGLVFRLRNIDALTEGMRVRVFGTPGLYKKSF